MVGPTTQSNPKSHPLAAVRRRGGAVRDARCIDAELDRSTVPGRLFLVINDNGKPTSLSVSPPPHTHYSAPCCRQRMNPPAPVGLYASSSR